jgi:hypothetical protein
MMTNTIPVRWSSGRAMRKRQIRSGHDDRAPQVSKEEAASLELHRALEVHAALLRLLRQLKNRIAREGDQSTKAS